MVELIKAAGLLLVLVNPFLLSIYLLDLIRGLDRRTSRSVLVRAALIATPVFVLFGWLGDRVFSDLLRIRFASFLLFGGLVFVLIALRFVFGGPQGLAETRWLGEPAGISPAPVLPRRRRLRRRGWEPPRHCPRPSW